MAMSLNMHRAKEVTIDTSGLEQHGWMDVRVVHEISEGHWVTDEITIHCTHKVNVLHLSKRDKESKNLVALKR